MFKKLHENIPLSCFTTLLGLSFSMGAYANYSQTQSPGSYQNPNSLQSSGAYQNSGSYQNPNYNQNGSYQNPGSYQNYGAYPNTSSSQSQYPNSYQNQNAIPNQNQNYYQNRNSNPYQQNQNGYNQTQNPSSYYQYQSTGDYYQIQAQGPIADATTDTGNNRTNANSIVSDQDLIKKIHDKLSSGIFSKGYTQVTAEVNNGNVTLQGVVEDLNDKDKIEKEIRNLDGVKSLSSQIVVRNAGSKESKEARSFPQDTYASSADDQLNKKIRDNVSKGWLWDSYKEVILNTNNGVVTLEGTVESIGDQQKLMTEIQKIDGVRSVNSNLKIKNRN